MKQKKSLPTRVWIIVLACVFVLSALAAFLLYRIGDKRHIARIYLDDELIYEIDLNTVIEEYKFTIDCEDGFNTISVRPGGICVSAANCPDGTCINQGWLEGGITPIICLPHMMVIQLEDAEPNPGTVIDIDAVAG